MDNIANIHLWELFALPFYLLIIYLVATTIQRRKIDQNPLYRYYVKGLFAKILGGIALVLIYLYYWDGGDTTNYFISSLPLKNLLLNSPGDWLNVEFGKNNLENFSLFTIDTGYPYPYMYFDPQTFLVIRIVSPLLLITFNSYMLTTVLLAWVSYAGIWRLFLVFSSYYPNRAKLFAIGVLFFPSLLFWGSGILKDTITLSCEGWVIYCIYKVFIVKENRFKFLIVLATALFIIISIKPYIVIAFIPGSLMWIFSNRISQIQNSAFKFLIIPIIIAVSIFGGTYILSSMGQSMGKYSLNRITTTLLITQRDLKQDYYHGHSFDIGLTDASTSGLVKKSPQAIVAGLFRPFLWESGNAVMLISGLENSFILYLTITSLFKMGLTSFFKKLLIEPLLFFAITFSLFFAFSVGISTANFGALVRFKVAYLPFYLCSIFILIKRDDEHLELSSVRKETK